MKKGIKIQQRDITDCGAACLASVAAFYGFQLPVSRIRQYAGTDKHGTNLMGLVEAAEKMGFHAKAAKGPGECLDKIPLPAVTHMILPNGLHHYIVVYKVGRIHIRIMDPADGRIHKKNTAGFFSEWSGKVLLLLPSEKFKKADHRISHYDRFLTLIRPRGKIVILALTAAILYTILGLSSSIYLQKIVDLVLRDGDSRLLHFLSIAMILIVILQSSAGIGKTILGLRTGQYIDRQLILGYYTHLLYLPQRFFDTMRIGEIISRVNDAVKIRQFINDTALSIVVNLLIVALTLAVMFLYYWKLALVMLGIFPLYILLYWLNNLVNKKWQRQLMEKSAELEAQLVESLQAARTIKSFGLEVYTCTQTENRFMTLLRNIYRSSVRTVCLDSISDLITRMLTIGILWTGSSFVIGGELTPGQLISFYALAGYITTPAMAIVNANKLVQDALIAADRLFEIIDLETEHHHEGCVDLTPEMVGDINFNNVHFRYGTRATVFCGLTVRIKKGLITAIVGESGSGKSSLSALLQNLYPVQEGSITIGSCDLQQISNISLRRQVSVVPQHIDLFAGSIIANIAIGEAVPDVEKIISISAILGISDFIERLPAGYETILHEQGINLSGGQRQRIAIARSLYRDPSILILDEATSSLDPAGEENVQAALASWKREEKTLIIIAHRLSTIKRADTILVLGEGMFAEQGTHEELLRLKGSYYAMWQSDCLRH